MSNQEKDPEEIDQLLFQHLEGLLDEKDAKLVEKYLSDSPEFAEKRSALEKTLALLKSNRTVLCPSPQILFDYTHAQPQDNAIQAHLERCESCRSLALEFQTGQKTTIMPAKVKEAFDRKFRETAKEHAHERSLIERVKQFAQAVRSFLTVPTMAMATAAAAIILAVLVYPVHKDNLYPALGDVSWKAEDEDLRIMGAMPKSVLPKAAILLIYKDFDTVPSQEKINDLYRAISPTSRLRKQLTFVDPAEVKQIVEKERVDLANTNDAGKILAKKLSIGRLFVVEISPKDKEYEIRAHLMETKNGQTIDSTVSKVSSTTELAQGIKESLNKLKLSNRS